VSRVIAWFATNHVAANLLMAILVIGGITSFPAIRKQTFPDIDVDIVTVSVEYRGAAPEEVEEGVCVRIEEAVEGVEGVEEISSTAVEGVCAVSIELISGTDVTKATNDIKNQVDAITTFPEDTEKPIVAKVTPTRPVMDLALSGAVEEATLKQLGQRVRDEIAALEGVTQVELLATRPYEVSIEVPEARLRRHGLSFDQVADAVRRSSLDLPGGSIKTEGGEILLRTKGQAYRGPDFERLVLLTRADGTRITLGDVATVIDGFEDIDRTTSFDGEPAVLVRVSRVGDQSTLAIGSAVEAYVAGAQSRLPEGLTLTIWQDQTKLLTGRIEILMKNGRAGFFLVLLVLALFLRLRLALWVAVGVPVSFAGALFVMAPLEIGINVISTFAFILVLGILVDDAIVMGESAYTWQEKTGDRLQGAIIGAQRVVTPVIFGVLTTVAAFMPLLLIEGGLGQVFGVMASVTIACLLFSMVESTLILPAHLGHGKPVTGEGVRAGAGRWSQLQDRFARGLENLIHGPYRRALGRVLEFRYAAVAVTMALLLWSVAWIGSGRMTFSFFPPVEGDEVTGLITMPQGTPADKTAVAAQQLVDAISVLQAELDAEFPVEGGSHVRHVMVSVGGQPFKDSEGGGPGGGTSLSVSGSHLAEIVLELVPSEDRVLGTREIEKRWRALAGVVPEAVEVSYFSSIFAAGEAINLQLQSSRIDHLTEAAERLKTKLAEYPGVIDIADSFRAGKREVKLDILPAAETLGLTLSDMARQVRQAFYGEEVQRIQRGRDDVRVMVRYPADERRSLGDLENMRIRTIDGVEVPFGTVARAELGRGYSTIRRSDRQRVVNVTTDIDRSLISEGEVLRNLGAGALPAILSDYPGMTVSLEGQQREQRRTAAGLVRWYPVALFLIYALLAVPLRSYLQPLLIMSVIPFGVVGAIVGHLLMGRDLSMMSVMGIIALSGVVVNSSLVLVHYVNTRRADGLSFGEAVVDAAQARFRPIVLTAATTFAGLVPLMLERSTQAQFLIPMAISISFGVVFATLVTLFVVPSGYLILEDMRGLPERAREAVQRRRRRPRLAPVGAPGVAARSRAPQAGPGR
jgi:multidrug efflux pump subunit AcrB